MFPLATLRKLRTCSICETQYGPAGGWYDTVRHLDFCHVCQASHVHLLTYQTLQVQAARTQYETAYLEFTQAKGQATETIQALMQTPRYLTQEPHYTAYVLQTVRELKAQLLARIQQVQTLSKTMDRTFTTVRQQYEHSLVKYADYFLDHLVEDASNTLHEEYDDVLEHRLLTPAEQTLHTVLSQPGNWRGLSPATPSVDDHDDPAFYHVYGAEGPYFDPVRGLCVRKLLWAFTWEPTVPDVDPRVVVKGELTDEYLLVRWPDEYNICLSEFQAQHPPGTLAASLMQRLRSQAQQEARWS
jgi:hypothetical protein